MIGVSVLHRMTRYSRYSIYTALENQTGFTPRFQAGLEIRTPVSAAVGRRVVDQIRHGIWVMRS